MDTTANKTHQYAVSVLVWVEATSKDAAVENAATALDKLGLPLDDAATAGGIQHTTLLGVEHDTAECFYCNNGEQHA